MAKRASNEKPANGKKSSFSELNDMLSKFSPDGAIIDDSLYAKIDEWIPTGYYILNAALSGSLFGGLPNRRSLMFAGAEGTGKTFIACSIVRNAQMMDYFPIYFDSEGSIDVDFVKRLGIDTSKFRIENIGTVEEFTNLAANIIETLKKLKDDGKTPPKIMIVLDSLGSLSSTKEKNDAVSGSDKRDMTKQQAIRKTFRVLGNDFAKYGIPFIVNNHVYAAIGSFVGGDVISGGGGGKYSPSIIFTLTKSQYGDTTDKVSEGQVKKLGLEKAKVGITITLWPYKQRFARPIPVKIYIPFYKKPNPFVGLERFVSWENCGIVRGNMLTEKEFHKLPVIEQKKCFDFLIPIEGLKPGDDGTRYAQPKDTARNLVCEHLGGEVPLAELYTDKVFTEEVLRKLDDNVIKKTFMLPSIESLEDLAEVTDLIDDAKMEDAEPIDDKDLLNGLDEIMPSED
jgi:RecA/RadA recombinase